MSGHRFGDQVTRWFSYRASEHHGISASDARRGRVVAAATIVAGTLLLGFSFRSRPGDPVFYLLTAALAVAWGVGGLLSGPIHLGYQPLRSRPARSVFLPFATGVVLAVICLIGVLVVRGFSPLRHDIDLVLGHASGGSLAAVAVLTATTGLAEEVFFRGGLFATIERYPVSISTAAHAIVTGATGSPMLVLAALILGPVLGQERRASGGVLAPIITHVTWSMLMLFLLPIIS